MGKDFVPYKQALALKEIGFDGMCFAFSYVKSEWGYKANKPYIVDSFDELVKNVDGRADYYVRPLYQQAFDFFRKTYELSSHCDILSRDHLGDNYYYQIINFTDLMDESTTKKVDGFGTYEDAKLACLKKLIELCS